ncbi:hypothetical protein QJQ45_017874 [Haematococcus lacustris]|nr:hypothetical protein QJQ45_017874 [Haematococcus lacustris]
MPSKKRKNTAKQEPRPTKIPRNQVPPPAPGSSSSAGTSLVANLKHITVTLATWDAVWEVYLDPKWARQRLQLYGAQDRALEHFFKKLEEEMAEVAMQRHGCAKQLVVFFCAASIGTRGGWGADAVLWACCKVVCRPRGTAQRRDRVVLVVEHRTSRVNSAVIGQQPCESRLRKRRATRPADWKPPAGQVEQRLLRPAWSQQRDQPVRGLMWSPVVALRKPPQPPCSSQAATQPAASEPGPNTPLPAKRSKRTEAEQAAEPSQPIKDKGRTEGKAAKAKPAPQPGRWLDQDCNAALNMQRIGESSHHVCALCAWLQLEEEVAEVAMERHGHAKQLVIFFGAATIGTGGKWGADAVLRACCKVVCRPRGTDQRRGRVVLVDEHRTTRVSSAVNGKQPCEGKMSLELMCRTQPY